MSHYTKASIVAQQKYEAQLLTALNEYFGQAGVETHDSKAVLRTWNGEDSGLKANIIIRKKNLGRKLGREVLANDLGYERDATGGYDVHVDETAFPKAAQDQVSQRYAELVAMSRLKAQGYKVKSAKLEDGRVQLTAMR